MKTVKMKDVTLIGFEGHSTIHGEFVDSHWVASFDGKASTKEYVHLERKAPHAGEALELLRTALADEGYELQ